MNLGTAGNFGVLGGQSVTSTGTTQITGDLGVSPGTSVTGFPPGLVSGTIHAGDTVAAQAQTDALTAYNALWAQAPTTTYSDTVIQLDGLTLTPGVYNFPSAANLQVGGTLTLDFQGNPNAVFIFQTGSTLVTMANSKVVAINTGTGSPSCGSNVYWAVGSSATIDGSQFLGTVIATTS
ncbi:ice-binding family protein, partial [Methanoregula sp.]|uniref:ice-binding family protein n=1 Tax=Methanoregula sp. TaxID=2052170 RepID=UPI003C70C3AA